MIKLLKNILGLAPKVDYKMLVKKGAQIIDVRTQSEFEGGHIKGAVNIPLHHLSSRLSRIKKDTPVITCCASGVRSASAKSLLKSHGFNDVYNGGSWVTLRNNIS
jgi:rhodanese-related sulfurtransferase